MTDQVLNELFIKTITERNKDNPRHRVALRGRLLLNGTSAEYQDKHGSYTLECTNSLYHYDVDKETDELYLFESDGTPMNPETVEYKLVSNWWGGSEL